MKSLIAIDCLVLQLNSQLKIEKARLKSLEKNYAAHSAICLPLMQATKAVIVEIKYQLSTYIKNG